MQIPFTKMHGLGNDFMVINATQQDYSFAVSQIQQLADRHFGVGFDQLLLIERSCADEMDFFYRIFNGNGREAEQCGNGLRCIAKYIFDNGLSLKKKLAIGTLKGLQFTELMPNNQIKVMMGKPNDLTGIEKLSYADKTLEIFSLNMGNPHAVMHVDNLEQAPVAELGRLLNQHPRFPNGVNVAFMQIVNPTTVRLRVFERGAGETLACGSGACAAVVAGHIRGLLAESVCVQLPGGELSIEVTPEQAVIMQGPAVTVYEGIITL